MKVLFADDTLDTRQLYGLVLRMGDHDVQLASDGLEAVEAVRGARFDVAIIDAAMPEMDGFEAIHTIRELENGVALPIILFTGYGGEEIALKATQAGADLVLQKPLLPSELLREISKLVKSRT